jgi:hypothetical protein
MSLHDFSLSFIFLDMSSNVPMMSSNTFFVTCIKLMLWQVSRSFQYGRNLKNFDCFLKDMWVEVGVFFLFYPFIVPLPNTTWMFFTISNRSFPVYHFGALSFSTVLSKCLFILRYLCFLYKTHWCCMNTNFLDDGRCSFIHVNRTSALSFSLPWNYKAPRSILDANKYDCF